jgi:hypothetical protein
MWHIERVIQVAVLREAERDQLDVQFAQPAEHEDVLAAGRAVDASTLEE